MRDQWERSQLAAIGYLPQDPRLPGHMRVRDALAYAQWLKCDDGGRERRHECLDSVGLADRADSKVRDLSGGMKRRLSLACALVAHPKLLLLDEPTVGLDAEQRSGLRTLIKSAAEDCAVVFSTHELAEVDSFDPRIVVLDAGRIAMTGSADKIRSLAPVEAPLQMRLEQGFLTLISGR